MLPQQGQGEQLSKEGGGGGRTFKPTIGGGCGVWGQQLGNSSRGSQIRAGWPAEGLGVAVPGTDLLIGQLPSQVREGWPAEGLRVAVAGADLLIGQSPSQVRESWPTEGLGVAVPGADLFISRLPSQVREGWLVGGLAGAVQACPQVDRPQAWSVLGAAPARGKLAGEYPKNGAHCWPKGSTPDDAGWAQGPVVRKKPAKSCWASECVGFLVE